MVAAKTIKGFANLSCIIVVAMPLHLEFYECKRFLVASSTACVLFSYELMVRFSQLLR